MKWSVCRMVVRDEITTRTLSVILSRWKVSLCVCVFSIAVLQVIM